ncbi:sensor histidine kinase [Clostridium sp. ZS2-4]|uniref:sensor histidine kinase n=1 Tax=Clostridium sp. ZS2-4 TaxID=2987703 RepID=UPI00227A3E71|nr:ATP-binding protein [Clostridium sp. ZS2-4]MCY6354452.1 ATP-binding protein [Clostridium sp. ZS2-4]
MYIIREFIMTFIELISIFILWLKFGSCIDNKIMKNLAIILISTFVSSITHGNIYINICSSYLVIILCVSLFYKKRFIRTCLEFLSVVFTIILIQIITIFILKVLIGKFEGTFIFNFSGNIAVMFFSIVIYYFVPSKKKYFEIDIINKVGYYFIINSLAYIGILKVIWDYDKNIILDNTVKLILILVIVLIFEIFSYRYIFKIQEEKSISDLQSKYTPILKNITDEIRQRQHDFKNHLNVINGLVEVTEEKQLKNKLREYIKTLNDSIKNIEDVIYIDNPILRAIIYIKAYEAEKKDIEFSYSIDNSLEDLNIKDYEVSEIITNIIDNAFEAIENFNGEKSVNFRIYLEEKMKVIEISNNGITIKPEDINNIFNKGFSTNKGSNRGYGLYNVKKIVERNKGEVQLLLKNNHTIFKVLL